MDPDAAPKKQLALSMALKQVEMAYGKGAVMQLGSKEVAKVSTRVHATNSCFVWEYQFSS